MYQIQFRLEQTATKSILIDSQCESEPAAFWFRFYFVDTSLSIQNLFSSRLHFGFGFGRRNNFRILLVYLQLGVPSFAASDTLNYISCIITKYLIATIITLIRNNNNNNIQ